MSFPNVDGACTRSTQDHETTVFIPKNMVFRCSRWPKPGFTSKWRLPKTKKHQTNSVSQTLRFSSPLQRLLQRRADHRPAFQGPGPWSFWLFGSRTVLQTGFEKTWQQQLKMDQNNLIPDLFPKTLLVKRNHEQQQGLFFLTGHIESKKIEHNSYSNVQEKTLVDSSECQDKTCLQSTQKKNRLWWCKSLLKGIEWWMFS